MSERKISSHSRSWVIDMRLHPRHVRILLHEQYRIEYLLKEDGNIDILGVFHGALDIARYQL